MPAVHSMQHSFRLALAPQDITVGNPAKAQLARAMRNPEEAFNLMKGSFFVVETKFDGRSISLWLVLTLHQIPCFPAMQQLHCQFSVPGICCSDMPSRSSYTSH